MPSKLIEAALVTQGGFPETLWGLRAIRSAFEGKIIHCESPPPIFSNDYLMEYAGVFKASFEKFGISPPILRHKLWRMHSDLIRIECKNLDIQYLPSPPQFINEEGFLTDSGFGYDTSHANAAYGKALITNIINL